MVIGIGALGGAITALFTEGVSYFKEQSKNKHELKLLELQQAIGKEETERESYIAAVEQYGSALSSSHQHDMSLNEGVSLWVKDLRASFRPVAGYSAYAFVFILACFGSSPDIKAQAAASIYIIAEAVTSFYFVNRMLKK